ncbi:MAG TPA: ABC transporter substrate-binding protein [Alphaproteobacteria bacterium]|nr:ABC transporter substrate-binding protein [Alphaproteobacteria bacterium]
MKRICLFAVLMMLSLPLAAHAAPATHSHAAAAPQPVAASASDVVRNFYATLVDSMKQGDQIGFAGRFKKLDPAVKAAFDMPTMTRFAVGSVWTKATPDEQQQLISAFSDFSTANYASQFKAYNDEQFEVVDEKPSPGGVIVETTLTPKGAAPVALNYMMHKDDKGNYRIVDVYLNGTISQLATRRSEFNAIVDRDGIPALVNSLDEKSKQMGPS